MPRWVGLLGVLWALLLVLLGAFVLERIVRWFESKEDD
jgi:hypothetical protein